VIYGYLQDPEVARLLQNVTVTLHGDRYVLPVKVENRGRLPGVVHRASNTGATVFVEPNASVELNNHLADLYFDERREVERLLNMLAIRLHGRTEEMAAAMHACGQVDLIAAKAQYAYQFDFTCPEVVERGSLQFSDARHPLLLDQACRQQRQGVPPEQRRSVVPIDVRLGSDFDILVITGSNTGGKTVALKTVALLVLMAQSGMHIPARRGSTMPVFRDVLIDIGDEQSLQQSLSTFGAHIQRIRHILSKADSGSLVLLDELGSGTDPDEGGAIGQAILDELLELRCLAMVTTHLSVLKAYAFNHERVDNASVEFDTKTMSPTYHLLIGTPGESHAIAVAKRLGMSKRVVAAARGHLDSTGKQFRKAIRATGQARQVAEEARAQAQQAELAAKCQQETYESKLADLHRLQREFETWLASLGELRPGDEVVAASLGKPGRLVRLELHRQVALVETENSVQIEVPLKQLMPDLGQQAVREQIAALRQQILDQASQTEAIRCEAQHVREEYHRSLQQQKLRARQFDAWLGAIARMKIGDEVPIARKPGKGVLKQADLPGLRATVETAEGEMTLSIQDIFPQTGPWGQRFREPQGGPDESRQAPRRGDRADQRPRQRGREGWQERQGLEDQPAGSAALRQAQGPEQRRGASSPPSGRQVGQGQVGQGQVGQGQVGQGQGQGPQRQPQGAQAAQGRQAPGERQPKEAPNRPMDRVNVGGRAAEAKIKALLALEPGQQVYVVPFHKRATLIRIQADKDLAVVQSGIFEMQIPLVDLEPLQTPPPAAAKGPRKKPPEKKPAGQGENKPDAPAGKTPGQAGTPEQPTPGEEKPAAAQQAPDQAEPAEDIQDGSPAR
jgi:DNA mismatch repair protein MutS2